MLSDVAWKALAHINTWPSFPLIILKVSFSETWLANPGLLRRPATAAIVVVTLVGLYFFVTATLNGMLGTNQEPLNLYG